MEGAREVVKRSGRNEPIWVIIHICMETTLGISLYSYPYLKLAKMLCLSYYCYVFSSTKLEKKASVVEGEGGGRGQGGEMTQTMYAQINKLILKGLE
jgi:hypothetical protein